MESKPMPGRHKAHPYVRVIQIRASQRQVPSPLRGGGGEVRGKIRDSSLLDTSRSSQIG